MLLKNYVIQNVYKCTIVGLSYKYKTLMHGNVTCNVVLFIEINLNNNNNNNNKDVAISGDRNVIKKEAEKILKCKDLTIEIQRMWNVKTKVIPAIIGATGTISKSFRKYVSNIPGNNEVTELQKTAILGTAHILRKVLT
jgi:hypothetical protein